MGSSNSKIGPFRPTQIDQVAVGNGAGAVAALPSLQGHTVVLRAICALGQTIYISIGTAGVSTTAKTWPMHDGDTLSFEVTNANLLAAFADAAGARLAYIVGTYC